MLIVSAFRFVLRSIGVALVASLTPALMAQSSSPVIDGFDPNVNGNVYAVAVQPDGKIVIAGSFTTLQPNEATAAIARNNIARLLPDGSNDSSFAADVGGQINSISLQANGQIVIGGRFTTVAGQTRNRVARLNADGSLDATFDPNVGGSLTPEVHVVLVQPDGRVLVGGGFTMAQPNGAAEATPRNRIARFNKDGTLDTGFNPNANSFVLSLAMQADGKILLGGGFTTLQPNGAAAPTERHRIARLNTDGTLDAFDPKANNAVTAIEALPDGGVLIGGSFTTLQPNGAATVVTANVTRLARLNSDGTIDNTFRGFADGQVYTLKVQRSGRILVGGSFGAVADGIRGYLARILPDGRLDFSYGPRPNFNVYAIALQADGSAVVAGGFTAVSGRGANSIVRNHVTRVLGDGSLDATFHPDVNGRLNAVAVQADGRILIAGSFTSIAGETHYGIARLEANGALDPSFGTDIDGGTVFAIAQQPDGKILLGGTFNSINGTSRINVARLNTDGTLDANFNFAADDTVNTIVMRSDSKILIGGSFNSVRPHGTTDGVSRPYVAQVNLDGSLDTGFAPFPNATVSAIAIQSDGKIVLGGSFSTMAGHGATFALNRLGIARLNADGTMDADYNPTINGSVFALALDADGKVIAGGSFRQLAPNGTAIADATERNNIVRLNVDGTLDAAFDPNPNGTVFFLARQADGKILMAGRFTELQPNKTGAAIPRNYVARLDATGGVEAFDLGLDILPGNQVNAAIPLANGQILVGGAFTTLKSSTASPVRRSRLARVNDDGSVDPTFDASLATAMGAAIESLTVQSDGRILAAGNFANVGGTATANLARFNLDSTPDVAFTPNLDGPVYAVAQQLTKGEQVFTPSVGLALLENNGQLRSSFVPPADVSLPTINTVVVQPDGKLLIGGGLFATPSTGTSLVRLNADGTLDTTFQPQTSGEIFAIALQNDGKILVGGAFTKVGDVDRANIARLNADGTLDAAFTLVTNGSGTVFALAVHSDGRIVLGGSFTSIATSGTSGTSVRAYAARVAPDGTVDGGFDPTFNGNVEDIVIRPDGKVLLVGAFTALRPNGTTTTINRAHAAQFNADGSFDSSFDLKLNGAAGHLTLQPDGKVLIGGAFTRILDQTRNRIARINTDNTLDTFNPNPNGGINSIALQADNKVLISGGFSALQPNSETYNPALAIPRSRAARLNSDGTVDPTFNPNFNNTVTGLIAGPSDSIVAFGGFSALQPTGGLIVGGSFTGVNGVPVNNLALFGRDGSVSSAFLPNPNGAVYAIIPNPNGQTTIAGAFTTVSGATRNRVARFTAADELDPGFNPNVDGEVYALALQGDGKLVIGGSFTSVGGVGRANLARLNTDGSLDMAFAPAVTGTVRNIVIQANGRVLITQAIDANNSTLRRLNADGSPDASFNAANNGAVNAIVLQANGSIVVGGSFTSIGGGARSNLARLNANGSLDPSLTSQPNGPVTALSIQPDGKILLGGMFNQVDGIARFGIARIGATAAATEALAVTPGRTGVIWLRGAGAPEINGAVFESSPDAITWTQIGLGERIGATGNWQVSNVTLPTTARYYVRGRGVVPSAPRASSGAVAVQTEFYASVVPGALPVITSPTVVNGLAGSSYYYGITASGQPTHYAASGLPAGLSVNSVTGLISGTPTASGTFAVTLYASNTAGQTSTTLTLIISPAAPNPPGDGKLINISVNAQVTAAEPIIAGFVIRGVFPQSVLLRAVGPTLATAGVPDPLAQPHLRLYDANNAIVAENAGWGDSGVLNTTFARVGAAPFVTGSKDAAMLITLAPGAYTMHVTSAAGASGTAVAEVYDASDDFAPVWPRLVNISGRSLMSDAKTTATGGFVIVGTAPRRVLIRGVGPAMAGAVPNALSDPTLKLYRVENAVGTVIASNDNWSTPVTVDAAYPPATPEQLSAAATTVGAGAFASGSADAALIATLAPGIYTAEVGRTGAASGSTVVEIYELDVP